MEKGISINEKIAVVCGGDGREREVSLRSGAAVCAALSEAGLNAETVDLRSLDEVEKLKGFGRVFIAMHGDWGEGGQLQARLEAAGIPYTGSDSRSSALALDKWQARECFKRAGLRVPKGVLLPAEGAVFDSVRELGPDVVVKPCCGGSTVGITIIKGVTPETLTQAAALARQSYVSDVLVEEYIEGRELTAAVWERSGKAEPLPVIEFAPKTGFYDYKNKYTSGATEYLVPAPLAPEVAARVAEAAVRAHQALGCRTYSRADFRLSPDGTPYLLEVNTAPGMTATSLVPKAAKAIGISMPDFVKEVVLAASL